MKIFNRKKLVAITNDFWAAEHFPIIPAKKFLPSWWEKTKRTYDRGGCPFKSVVNLLGTIKNCSGVSSMLNAGFILRAWRDMSILVNPDGRVMFAGATESGSFDAHPKAQHENYRPDLTFLKLVTPWMFEGDKTKFISVPPIYHDGLSGVDALPMGIVSFEHQESFNVFIGVKPREEPYEIFIRAGDPIAHLIPLCDDEVGLTVVYDKSRSIRPLPFFFNRYARLKSLIGGKK